MEATLTTPLAPQAMNGKVSPSSPDRTVKSESNATTVSETLLDRPPASLSAQIWGWFSRKRFTVSVEISIPQREGME